MELKKKKKKPCEYMTCTCIPLPCFSKMCVYTDRGYRRNRLDVTLGLQVCLKATQQGDTIAALSL